MVEEHNATTARCGAGRHDSSTVEQRDMVEEQDDATAAPCALCVEV